MSATPRIALTTASFLPATALSASSIRRVLRFASAEGFAGVEILMTRAACAAVQRGESWADAPVVSAHEVWNPRDTLRGEIRRIATRTPQSRGMVPYPMDCVFFRDSDVSEAALFAAADKQNAVAVVSQLASPVTGQRYASPCAAVQVHPDLGPGGAHMPLEAVMHAVEAGDYDVVLDTYHVRRRVRMYVAGKTEINPPAAASGDASLGGIQRVWSALGKRVRLVHFQPGLPAELAVMLKEKRFPPALKEFADLLPELARRGIPIVVEASPVVVSAVCESPLRAAATGKGFWGSAMRDTVLRIRDVLVR
ncbi:MAG TPA: hypothetical protein VIH35_03095 [Kiritimatiellia bacterium]|jgi:hypothetical protein